MNNAIFIKKKIIIGIVIFITIILLFFIMQLSFVSASRWQYDNKKYQTAYNTSEYIIIKNMLGNYQDKIDIMHNVTFYCDDTENFEYKTDDYSKTIYTSYLTKTIARCIGYSEYAKKADCSKEVDEIRIETAQAFANAGYDVISSLNNYFKQDEDGYYPYEFYPLSFDNPNIIPEKISELSNDISKTEVKSIKNEKNPLSITNKNLKKDGDYWYCTGTVKNKGSKTYYFVEVRVTYYDSNKKVLTTDWTYAVDSKGIRTGENQQFEIMTKINGEVDSYKVEIQDYND